MNESPFRQQTVVGLSIMAVASLVAFLVSSMLGEEMVPPRSTGPSAYSRSALGYHAFAELLRRYEIPVVLNRHQSVLDDPGDALLVITEPQPDSRGLWSDRPPGNYLNRARNVLLVLPKWRGTPATDNLEWLSRVRPVRRSVIEEVIAETGIEAIVNQPATAPTSWSSSELSAIPTLSRPQLLESDELEPLLSSPKGVLLGRLPLDPERPEVRRYVLSDPDLLTNHGLGTGQNSAVALEMIHLLAPDGRSVILDETMHASMRTPNVWGELLRFPLVLTLLQAGVATAVLCWCAMRRFGAPLPTADAVRTGKRTLIDNTAELLFFGGHHRAILRSYLQLALRSTSRACHLPDSLTFEQQSEQLRRIGAQRGATITTTQIHRAVLSAETAEHSREHSALEAASLIHQWRKEMIDGTR